VPSSSPLDRGEEVASEEDEVSDESSSSSSEEDEAPQPCPSSFSWGAPSQDPTSGPTMRGDHHVSRRASAEERRQLRHIAPHSVVTPRSVFRGRRWHRGPATVVVT